MAGNRRSALISTRCPFLQPLPYVEPPVYVSPPLRLPSLSMPNPDPVNPSRPSLALYYPYFLGGGAEAVCLWMIEALKQRYALTLFTLVSPRWSHLNAMYGTHIEDHEVVVQALVPQKLGSIVHFWVANNPDCRKIAIHWVLRYFKAKTARYAGVISGYNGADLGRPGIQYVHWVKVLEGDRKRYNRISNFSLDRLRQNLSLVNSGVVAQAVAKNYGTASQILYPPVVIPVVNVPWTEKTDSFICSGRLVAAKAPHRVIEMVSQLRQQGQNVHLHLTGGGGGMYAQKYQRFLGQLIRDNPAWITLHENLSYGAYVDLLSTCRYGIHIKQEPFGIVVAEMLKAGIIPFVRSKGGQVEIVGSQPELLFDDETDGVAKILAVLQSPDLQHQLLTRLHDRKVLFSSDRFCQEMTTVVDRYLQTPHPG